MMYGYVFKKYDFLNYLIFDETKNFFCMTPIYAPNITPTKIESYYFDRKFDAL